MNAGDPSGRCELQHDPDGDDDFVGHDVADGFDVEICGLYSSACTADVLHHSSSYAVPAGDPGCTVQMNDDLKLETLGSVMAKACH